jgi:hypothetical protein
VPPSPTSILSYQNDFVICTFLGNPFPLKIKVNCPQLLRLFSTLIVRFLSASDFGQNVFLRSFPNCQFVYPINLHQRQATCVFFDEGSVFFLLGRKRMETCDVKNVAAPENRLLFYLNFREYIWRKNG